MHILPMNPVETLAPVTSIMRNDNPGIVPPWIVPTLPNATGNTGIVPPWMLSSTTAALAGNDNIGIVPPYISEQLDGDTLTPGPGRNPGIVPPWLQGVPA